jgi:hypothetical protein
MTAPALREAHEDRRPTPKPSRRGPNDPGRPPGTGAGDSPGRWPRGQAVPLGHREPLSVTGLVALPSNDGRAKRQVKFKKIILPLTKIDGKLNAGVGSGYRMPPDDDSSLAFLCS